MKKRQRLIVMLLSFGLVFKMCATELTVQTVMASGELEDESSETSDNDLKVDVGEGEEEQEQIENSIQSSPLEEELEQETEISEENLPSEKNQGILQMQTTQESVNAESMNKTSKPVIRDVIYYPDSGSLRVEIPDSFDEECYEVERYVYSANRTDFDGSDYTGYNWSFSDDAIQAYASDKWYIWTVDTDGNVSDMYTWDGGSGYSSKYYDAGQLPTENPGNIGGFYFSDKWMGKDEHQLEIFESEKSDDKELVEGKDYTKISFIDKKGHIVYVITGKGKYQGTIIRSFDECGYKTMEEIKDRLESEEYTIIDLKTKPEIEELYRINENGWLRGGTRFIKITYPKIADEESGVAGYYISYDKGETWSEPPMNTYINDGMSAMEIGPDRRNGENLTFSYMFVYCTDDWAYIAEPSEPMTYKRDTVPPTIKKAIYDGNGHIVVEAVDDLSGIWKFACSQDREDMFYTPYEHVVGEASSIPVNANGKWYICASDKAGIWSDMIEVEVSGLNANAQTPSQPDKSEVSNPVKVTGIGISGISKKIAAGKKIKLTANISPSNAANKAVTWKSSNTKAATVNSSGTVTMKKNSGGKSVTITATAKDGSGVKATYKITSMKGVVKKVAVSGSKSVKAGKTLKLKAKVTASKKANTKLKWTSSNKKYATVSSSGKVKALKAGKGKKVKITVQATDGSGKKKTVTIKIK